MQMNKVYYLLFLLYTSTFSAQILTVSSGSSISISENSSISIDGLELAPSSMYVVSGPNAFDRISTPIVVDDNTSINRVYTTTAELTDYLGTLTFRYSDSELNGISESDLVLEVLDANDVWDHVVPIIDDVNNILSYDFTELVGFKKVTASSINNTLTVEPIRGDDIINIYPNPSTDYIYIKSNYNYQSTIYNMAGQRVLESNSKQLDVIDLPTGTYLLYLKSYDNSISTFKIIKK